MLHRNREKAIQSIVDYVEGEINILQFQELLETNRKLQGILSDYAKSVNNCIFGKEIIKYTMQLKNSISDKESLQEIAAQLERWYGMHFFFVREKLKQEKFTGVVLKNYTIEQILSIIEKTTNVKFSVEGQTVVVN